LAAFRTSWTDPNAIYLAIKAGSPGASHGHMDIGSFIMEADGVRWSLDLGMQAYHTLEARGFGLWDGRQGGDRWKLFRYHNRGHSTLLVDDREQVVKSHAPITEFSAEKTMAVVDMSATYAGQLASAQRRFSIEVISPAGAKWQSWPADPPPHDFDERNPGASVVGFIVPLAAGQETTLKVALTPASGS
jgi:hypothetical protein